MTDPSEASPSTLTREKILAATHEVVRRHGPTKATVVDVALVLGVSHGSIYRFFPTKAALRIAVVGEWVNRIADALESRTFEGLPSVRLKAWFQALREVKRLQKAESPELFEAFRVLAAEEPEAIVAYKKRLVGQIASLLTEGMKTGEFRPVDPESTGRAFLSATVPFHHPAFARTWGTPQADEEFETLWTLLVQSIRPERNPH